MHPDVSFLLWRQSLSFSTFYLYESTDDDQGMSPSQREIHENFYRSLSLTWRRCPFCTLRVGSCIIIINIEGKVMMRRTRREEERKILNETRLRRCVCCTIHSLLVFFSLCYFFYRLLGRTARIFEWRKKNKRREDVRSLVMMFTPLLILCLPFFHSAFLCPK